MSRFRNLRRAAGQTAGPPASLLSGEIFYNMTDGIWYGGFGDNGSGTATSALAFASDDFRYNLPEGTNGKVLSFSGGAPVWTDPPEGGASYTAGTGLSLTGAEFSVNFTVVAERTWVSSNFAAASHTHNASDINAGVLNVARIPDMDANKITSGVLDVARIPVLPSQVQVVSTGGIADLTSPQQATIGQGTVVTTTDGRRWVYSGTGSKTSEASYTVLADVTPEWTAIANKPAFGTISTQDADDVAITGGTLDGVEITNVILDAGTA